MGWVSLRTSASPRRVTSSKSRRMPSTTTNWASTSSSDSRGDRPGAVGWAGSRSRAISRATRARPRGDRSSWLMAPRSSRWPRTMASTRSAIRLKLTATSRTSIATQCVEGARLARKARSPPPTRSAANASFSRGRAIMLATRPAMSDRNVTTSPMAMTNRHHPQGTLRGPNFSISSAPTSSPPRTTGTKMCWGFSGTIAMPRPTARVHARGQLVRIAYESHLEAGHVAHLLYVGARRLGFLPDAPQPRRHVARDDLRAADRLRAHPHDDERSREDGEQDGAEEPPEEAGPQRARAVHGSAILAVARAGPHGITSRLRALTSPALSRITRLEKDVADAADRPDALGLARIVAQLLPQVRHVDVERTVDARVVAAALRQHGARELLARHRLPRPASKGDEHAKFERRELQLASPDGRLVRRARRPAGRRPRGDRRLAQPPAAPAATRPACGPGAPGG